METILSLAGNDVSDVHHAISLALELTNKYAGELYISESGHLEFAFSANAGGALAMAFHAIPGEAFGFMAGSPAAIGLVMADTAMKASAIHITRYMTPSVGTSHSNEVILAISGDASAVKEAVLQARQIGLELLIGMGSYPEIPGTPYLNSVSDFLQDVRHNLRDFCPEFDCRSPLRRPHLRQIFHKL